MQTRDQKLAAAVFERVSKYKSRDKAAKQKYGSMAHKLPVLIRTAGLAQALAFVEARGDAEQQRLLSHLAEVMGRGNLVELSRSVPLAEYVLLTREALAALLWFKRFAQSVLEVEASDEAEAPHAS